MTIDKELLDGLTAKAQESPRLRMNMDLRDTPEDRRTGGRVLFHE